MERTCSLPAKLVAPSTSSRSQPELPQLWRDRIALNLVSWTAPDLLLDSAGCLEFRAMARPFTYRITTIMQSGSWIRRYRSSSKYLEMVRTAKPVLHWRGLSLLKPGLLPEHR